MCNVEKANAAVTIQVVNTEIGTPPFKDTVKDGWETLNDDLINSLKGPIP